MQAVQIGGLLRSGREVHCGADLDDAALRRLVHVLEEA